MTGAEHYAESERLLALADDPVRLSALVSSGRADVTGQAFVCQMAQVHATLAVAAAAAYGSMGMLRGESVNSASAKAWRKVIL